MFPTALHKIQNERPEPGCESVLSHTPEWTVKISSEIETWRKTTTNCTLGDDHRISERLSQTPKTGTHLENQ
jgi:hypothetical protein